MATSRRPAPMPTRAEILRFIEESPGRVGKREIARAFGIRGDQRSALRELLADMSAAGEIGGRQRRAIERRGGLPPVTVIEITETDVDGEVYARPIDWRGEGAPPRIVLGPSRRGPPAPGPGDRLLARLTRREDDLYEAQAMRMVGHAPREVIGVYRRSGDQGRLEPTDRRLREEFRIAAGDRGGARVGDLVVAEVLPGRRLGPREARVRERVGSADAPGAYSLIAIHNHGIPTRFTAAALGEAEAATTAGLGAREDLRELALITIDPAEARDHDDAVWARPDPARQGGWEIIVAIADVAHYVRAGGALDREARERGNSVYFPDRVVPMLPEALSADLCSLRKDEDRACVAVRIKVDAEGRPVGHAFMRGLMKVRANLTYEAAQAAHDASAAVAGENESLGEGLAHLYGAYDALRRERERRAPLDLDLPERRVRLGPGGEVVAIDTPPRLDSHRLIEEYMIAANVRAAETLERARAPCVYRVHDRPAPEKVEALRDFLATLNYRLAKGQVLRPRHFNGILERAATTPHAHVVNEIVLRSQAQALYSIDNVGHFGLGLRRYAHFTSPIRRYADLMVHRALISALGLGEDGLIEGGSAPDADQLAGIAADISAAERRGIAAEREALDRYTAAFMADKVDAEFDGRISGVARFGMFVSLPEIGANGLVPMSSLDDDYYQHDPARHALIGRRHGRSYRLGDRLAVRLVEATPLTGGLRFELVDEEQEPPTRAGPRGRRG